jgi:hypothetical protein
MIPRQERDILTDLCFRHHLDIVYFWHALVTWRRIRKDVINRRPSRAPVHAFLAFSLELSVLWLGPQSRIHGMNFFPYDITSMSMWIFPGDPPCSSRAQLQILVFLRLLQGRIATLRDPAQVLGGGHEPQRQKVPHDDVVSVPDQSRVAEQGRVPELLPDVRLDHKEINHGEEPTERGDLVGVPRVVSQQPAARGPATRRVAAHEEETGD